MLGSSEFKLMSKVTLEEKRLKALKQQLFGKETQQISVKESSIQTSRIESIRSEVQVSPQNNMDTSFLLKNDLIKVLAFSSIALGIQLFLYFGSKSNLIKIPFLS